MKTVLAATQTPFHGSFTIGLLATHFMRLIDDRLALSQCFIALMELVKTVNFSQDVSSFSLSFKLFIQI